MVNCLVRIRKFSGVSALLFFVVSFYSSGIANTAMKSEKDKSGKASRAAKETYRITSKKSPKFMEAVIDPQDVHVGDEQTMSVTVQDDSGVSSVYAEVETDSGKKSYKLKRISGDYYSGTWSGQWTVHDTHSKIYRTKFKAANRKGESNFVTLAWSDPCVPPPGGSWALDGNCSFSNVGGVEAGTVTINNNSFTLTVNPGATFVWNSTQAIKITAGNFVISANGKLVQTNLWMIDKDSDTYPANTTQFAQDTSTGTHYKRRYTLTTYSSDDCYDTRDFGASGHLAYPEQTTCYTTNRGDGSYDYNCVSGNQICSQAFSGGCNSCAQNVGCGGSGGSSCVACGMYGELGVSGSATTSCK